MLEVQELPNSRVAVKKHQTGVRSESLLSLVYRFSGRSGFGVPIKKPDHQREYVWSPAKEKGWITDIMDGNIPPNMITLYFTEPEGDLYINDGLQRLTATRNLLERPEQYGTTEEMVNTVLSTNYIAVWVEHYENPKKIVLDFAKSQLQTQCTAYEQCLGFFTCDEKYHAGFKPKLEKIHDAAGYNIAVLTKNAMSDARQFRHKAMRNDFGLFLRFVTKRQDFYDFMTNASTVSYQDLLKENFVEAGLKQYFRIKRPHELDKDIDVFGNFIKEVTGLIETEWRKITDNSANNVTETLIRHFYDVAIWCRNNEVSLNLPYRSYVHTILRHTGGAGVCDHPASKKSNKQFIFKIDGAAQLREVDRAFGVNLVTQPKHKRQRHQSAGIYQNGHIQSHYNGGEETEPQDGFANRALGKNDLPSPVR